MFRELVLIRGLGLSRRVIRGEGGEVVVATELDRLMKGRGGVTPAIGVEGVKGELKSIPDNLR